MTELQVIEQKRRETIEETRKRRDKSLTGLGLVAVLSVCLNIFLFMCCIYILQAGPI